MHTLILNFIFRLKINHGQYNLLIDQGIYSLLELIYSPIPKPKPVDPETAKGIFKSCCKKSKARFNAKKCCATTLSRNPNCGQVPKLSTERNAKVPEGKFNLEIHFRVADETNSDGIR